VDHSGAGIAGALYLKPENAARNQGISALGRCIVAEPSIRKARRLRLNPIRDAIPMT
jgi:hypothetical protein